MLMFTLLVIVVNILAVVVVFGVCILRQVLILRKEVKEAANMVSQLKSRGSYTEAYAVAGGAGGRGAGGLGAGAYGDCPRVILHYNLEE